MMGRLINTILVVLLILAVHIGVYRASHPPTYISVSPNRFAVSGIDNPFINIFQTYIKWSQFLSKLVTHERSIVLWSGYGGWTIVEEMVAKDLVEAQKTKQIKIIVVGIAASAHALTLCQVSNTYVTPMAVLMFHLPMTADGESVDRSPEIFEPCVQRGILTREDVDQLTDASPKEVWITFDDEGRPSKQYLPDRRLKINGGTAE